MCSEHIVPVEAVAVGVAHDIHDPGQVVVMAVAIPIPYRYDDNEDDGEVSLIDLADDSIQLLIEQNIALRQQVELGKQIIGAVLILMIMCIVIFIMNISPIICIHVLHVQSPFC